MLKTPHFFHLLKKVNLKIKNEKEKRKNKEQEGTNNRPHIHRRIDTQKEGKKERKERKERDVIV